MTLLRHIIHPWVSTACSHPVAHALAHAPPGKLTLAPHVTCSNEVTCCANTSSNRSSRHHSHYLQHSLPMIRQVTCRPRLNSELGKEPDVAHDLLVSAAIGVASYPSGNGMSPNLGSQGHKRRAPLLPLHLLSLPPANDQSNRTTPLFQLHNQHFQPLQTIINMKGGCGNSGCTCADCGCAPGACNCNCTSPCPRPSASPRGATAVSPTLDRFTNR